MDAIVEINFNFVDLLFVSPILALFISSTIPILLKVLRGNKELQPMVTLSWGVIGIVSALILAFSMAHKYRTGAHSAFEGALIFDGTSIVATVLVLLVTLFSLIYSKESVSIAREQFSEFVFLMLNAAVGMLLVAWSHDLIVTFIGIEVMSLCLYILIALSREGTLSKEASFKYFVLGSFASAIFLYGVAFIYGSTGSTYILEIKTLLASSISTNRLMLLGVVFTVLGFCFKVSIAPFHAWTPDVYEGAPTPVTAFMATGVKVVTFFAFLRFITTSPLTGARVEGFVMALQWLAVITMLVGNIAAIMQKSLKRMLAYSSIAHSGYVMVALIAAGLGGKAVLGASGVVYYAFVYSVMTIGAFGVVSYLEKDCEKALFVDDVKGISRKHPWLALCLMLFMLSLAGIPPTLGFMGKFYIFTAAINQQLYWAAFWGVISSVISVYYYLRPIVYMYMSEPEEELVIRSQPLTSLAYSLAAILVVAGSFFVEPIYRFILNSSSYLF